jgi:Flp pilus assembly protein protease CpaA
MFHIFGFAFYFAAAVIISLSDIKYRTIRNRDLAVFLLFGIFFNASDYTLRNFQFLLVVSLICISLHLAFSGKIGAGDLKLFWVLFFWVLNFTKWLEGVTLAWILGGVFALAFLALTGRGRERNFSIPFAPFIFLGFLPAI